MTSHRASTLSSLYHCGTLDGKQSTEETGDRVCGGRRSSSIAVLRFGIRLPRKASRRATLSSGAVSTNDYRRSRNGIA